jgi:hypothetical protein
MSRKTGLSSFQKYKTIIVDRKKKIIPRDFGNPDDIIMLGATHAEMIKNRGRKWHREIYIKNSPWHGKKVPAKNG